MEHKLNKALAIMKLDEFRQVFSAIVEHPDVDDRIKGALVKMYSMFLNPFSDLIKILAEEERANFFKHFKKSGQDGTKPNADEMLHQILGYTPKTYTGKRKFNFDPNGNDSH